MREPRPQPVVHLELHTDDLPLAASFYAGLCGWRPEPIATRSGTYVGLPLGRQLGGGMVQCAAPHPLWLPYVEVDCVSAATERARELGARILLDAREGPTGWRSVVAAPAAGEIALWQAKR